MKNIVFAFLLRAVQHRGDMFGKYLDAVRAVRPLVHSITNYVTVNDVANAVLAVGASPIMADDAREAADMASICSALNINIGTLNERTVESMIAAGRRANELSKPVVLDPVGAGASAFRNETVKRLLGEVKISVIKANASEMKFLCSGAFGTRGVDVSARDRVGDSGLREAAAALKMLACANSCVVAMTGEIDIVCDSQKAFAVRNGCAEMEKITGTGCQLSGIAAAFAAVDSRAESVAAAVCAMAVAGEIGFENMLACDGNATYRNRIIDALSNLDGTQLDARAKVYEL